MIFSLSHNDLDGYACQYLISKIKTEVMFFNSSYGKAINNNLEKIFEKIKKNDTLLITDLNLTVEQSDILDLKQKEIGFKLILIDHHQTGLPSAKKYKWYNLDISMSATKSLYLFLLEKKLIQKSNDLDFLVDCVNSFDMWENEPKNILSNVKISKKDFLTIGSSLSQNIVFSQKDYFPKIFEQENRELIFHLLHNASTLLQNKNIMYFEEKIYNLIRVFLGGNYKNNNKIEDNVPIHILKANFLSHKVWSKDIFKECIIEYKNIEYKGMIFFGLENIFQEFSYELLEKNKDLDFVVNITEFGKMSFRSIKKFKMNYMVADLFGGGGHENACGALLFSDYKKKNSRRMFSSI